MITYRNSLVNRSNNEEFQDGYPILVSTITVQLGCSASDEDYKTVA